MLMLIRNVKFVKNRCVEVTSLLMLIISLHKGTFAFAFATQNMKKNADKFVKS